jgi:hypothetical protein
MGMDNANGPHIPIQWKLPKNPNVIAAMKNISMNLNDSFVIKLLAISFPRDLHFIQGTF